MRGLPLVQGSAGIDIDYKGVITGLSLYFFIRSMAHVMELYV
jgi:hypothetical protein